MSDKKKTPNRNTFVKGVLRRASFHWKPRTEALQKARVERGKYKCAMCGELFGPKEVDIDHIHPVVDPRVGFTGFNDYIERLFCDADQFQILCRNGCHPAKCRLEDSLREHYKSEKEVLPDFTSKKKRKSKKKEVDNE